MTFLCELIFLIPSFVETLRMMRAPVAKAGALEQPQLRSMQATLSHEAPKFLLQSAVVFKIIVMVYLDTIILRYEFMTIHTNDME